MTDTAIGGVSVEIAADLHKLLGGFKDAQRAAERFDKQAGGQTKAAADKMAKAITPAAVAADRLTKSTTASAKSIDAMRRGFAPTAAAGDRYVRSLNSISAASGKAERQTRLLSNGMRNLVGVAVAGLSVRLLAGQLAGLADEANKISAQLHLATREFGSFATAQSDVQRISAETRNGLSATAKLYGNLVRASEPLGRTQEDAARATETFAKALKIGGAGAAEASSATLQFNQALASGVLRGDEFNSIAEASPRILKLLADSLGVLPGDLRAMAEAGELSADKLYTALTDRKFTESIDAEFRQLPVTFDEAMQRIHDAAVIAFGAFDRGGQFSQALANFVLDGSQGFAELEAKAEEFGIQTRAVLTGLSDAFAPLIAAGDAAFAFLEGRSHGAGVNIRRDIQKSLDDIDKATEWLSRQGMLGAVLTGNPIMGANGTERGTDFGGRFSRSTRESERSSRARIEAGKLQDRIGFTGPIASAADLMLKPAGGTGGTTDRLASRLRGLIGEYDKLAAAQTKYSADLKDIEAAEKAGLITADKANLLRKEASDALEKVRLAQNKTPGVRESTRGANDYVRAMQSMAERAADLDLRLTALNEQWPDRDLDAARLKTELYADAQDATKKLTDEQRAALMREADAIVEKTIALRDAEIAQDRLNIKAEQYIELMERLGQPLDVTVDLSGVDAMVRATTDALDDLNRRTDDFADGFADAFARAGQDILELKNPLDVLRNLLMDLASEFQREFVLEPFRDFVREKAGVPIAEKLIGGSASGPGVQISTFNGHLQTASLALASFTSAVQGGTSAALLPKAPTGPLFDTNQQPTFQADEIEAAADGVAGLGDAAAKSTAAMQAQVPVVGQFGSALGQAISMLSSGGGGGGLLGTLLQVGGMVAGSMTGNPFGGAVTSAGTSAVYGGTLGGIYAEGGFTGPGGKHDPAGIVHRGEFVMTAEATRRLGVRNLEAMNRSLPGFARGGLVGRVSDTIAASRMPGLGEDGLPGARGMRGGAETHQNFNINIAMPKDMDERGARRTAKQLGAEMQRQIATSSRAGISG